MKDSGDYTGGEDKQIELYPLGRRHRELRQSYLPSPSVDGPFQCFFIRNS